MVSKPLSSLTWGSEHKPMRIASGHSLGRQEWGDPMRVTSGDSRSQEGVIMTSYITWVWEMRCTYMYIHILLDTTRFKAMMAMNLS
jgi:hypothetical protein